MTNALPFTEASLARRIKGARKAGLFVVGVTSNGTIITADKPVDPSSSPHPRRQARLRDLQMGGQAGVTTTMGQTDLEYLSREPDRHGNDRLYVRRFGKRIRLREKEGTPEFARAYADAVDKLGPAAVKAPVNVLAGHPVNTFGWLGAQYFKSKGAGEFLTLDKDSQRARRNDLEECFQIALDDDNPDDPMGNCPLKYLSAQKMKRMIEAVDGPGARTNRRKHLSALCSWGVENKHLASNPVRDIKAGRHVRGGGFYTWMIPDVQQFLHHHRTRAASTDPAAVKRSRKAILALGLLLFGGTRRQDMVTLGKQHARGDAPGVLGDWLRYIPKKTIKRRRDVSQKPLQAPDPAGRSSRNRPTSSAT